MTPPIPPQSIPDPMLFQNGPRQCVTFFAQNEGRTTGLVVIYLDTWEHQVYGDVHAVAEMFWRIVAADGKNLVKRTEDAEARIAAMERGAAITVNAEIRSRVAEWAARAQRADDKDTQGVRGGQNEYVLPRDTELILQELGVQNAS